MANVSFFSLVLVYKFLKEKNSKRQKRLKSKKKARRSTKKIEKALLTLTRVYP